MPCTSKQNLPTNLLTVQCLLGSSILAQDKVKSCCTKVSKAKVTEPIIKFFSQRNKHLTSTPSPASSISGQTRVRGSTQATDSSPIMNIKK
uniref:Uncharacterized protein n=2 Tax=Cyprinus carpio TaxID=7962 RepID=A0A8C1A9A1_CYPCA